MINKKSGFIAVSLFILWFIMIACGIGMPALPGAGATSLWPDVPPFIGATQDTATALGTSLFNQAQANEKSKMETMLFYTDQQPSDVAAFYSDDLMKKQGWTSDSMGNSKSGCYQEKIDGQPVTICQFVKTNEEGRKIDLSIDARPDKNSNRTRLVYVRISESIVTK